MTPMLPVARRRSLSQPPPDRFKLLSPEAQAAKCFPREAQTTRFVPEGGTPAQFVIDLVDGVATQAKGKELGAPAHPAEDAIPLRTLRLEGFGANVVKEGVFKVPAGRPVQLFDAPLERAEGQHFGALLQRWSPYSLVIIRLLPQGLLARWNAANPKKQILVGDLINKVVADDKIVAHKDMARVLESTGRGKLLVSLGRKGGDGEVYFDAAIQKHARFHRLGLDLLIDEEELVVTRVVEDGPTCKWNAGNVAGPTVAVGDSIVAVNDFTGSPTEMHDALDSPKMSFVLTIKKQRQTELVKGDLPSFTLDVALAPKTATLIEEREKELLATNTMYVERSEAFDVNGRETYWSLDGKYYVFLNSFREWCVGKAEHFNVNRGSPDSGRRFALAVDCRRDRGIWEAGCSRGWLQWDLLLGQWVCPCEGVGVAEVGLTSPDDIHKHITVILPGGREQTVHVPTLASLHDVAAEVQKRFKVAEGKELRFRQGGRELDMGSRILRVNLAAPLEAGVFSAHGESRGGSPRRAHSPPGGCGSPRRAHSPPGGSGMQTPSSPQSVRSLHSPLGLQTPRSPQRACIPQLPQSPRSYAAMAGLGGAAFHGHPTALDASPNSPSSVSSPTSASSGSPRRRGRARLATGGGRRVPEQWLKIPCDALFVDNTHVGR